MTDRGKKRNFDRHCSFGSSNGQDARRFAVKRRRRQTPKIPRQILRSTRCENANAAFSNGETRRELPVGSVTEERPRKVLVGLTLGFSVANDEKSRRKKTGITCTFFRGLSLSLSRVMIVLGITPGPFLTAFCICILSFISLVPLILFMYFLLRPGFSWRV